MANIINKYITKNPYFKDGQWITGSNFKGFVLHSVGCNQPNPNVFISAWDNPSYTAAGINGFIGADAVYITAPCLETKGKVKRMPHSGNKNSNNSYIGFEMCEPGQLRYSHGDKFTCSDANAAKNFVKKVYNNAVDLFAQLCKFHGKNPLDKGVIYSHNELGKLGIGSDHTDPEHLWKGLGLSYTMDGFRRDVSSRMNGSGGSSSSSTSSSSSSSIPATITIEGAKLSDSQKKLAVECYKYITSTMKYSSAVTSGILANIYREGSFMESVYTKDHYDSGANNNAGAYATGLCMWTGPWRDHFINWCKEKGLSRTTINAQLKYLHYTLTTDVIPYISSELDDLGDKFLSWSNENTEQKAYDAAHEFHEVYEKSAGYTAEAKRRGSIAIELFNQLKGVSSYNTYRNLGQRIVDTVREQVGKSYSWGGTGPDSFDCSGLIYYCYPKHGISMPVRTADAMYNHFKNLSTVKQVYDSADLCSADLLFYENGNGGELDHIAVASGDGTVIHAVNSTRGVVEDSLSDSYAGNWDYALRLLSDNQTSQGGWSYTSGGSGSGPGSLSDYEDGPAVNFISLSNHDIYASAVETNLARVESAGYDYGYLIDITPNRPNNIQREFKFYIPEFSESAGANWHDVEITGRSVTIKAYQSTNSRSITISLDLYAGAGLYEDNNSKDIVGKMHSDANFLKSLEYPDYQLAIARPPATVLLILGSAVNITGVVSDVVVDHMKPLDSQNRAMYLKVSFTVTQIAINPPDYTDILNNRYATIDTDEVGTVTDDSKNILTLAR